MLLGMTGSWPNPIALWYEDEDGFYSWDFQLDLWTFYGVAMTFIPGYQTRGIEMSELRTPTAAECLNIVMVERKRWTALIDRIKADPVSPENRDVGSYMLLEAVLDGLANRIRYYEPG